MYKLLVSYNHDMILGEMIDVVFKKKACIDKLYAIRNAKSYTYEKKAPKSKKQPEVHHMDPKKKYNDNKLKWKFTKLTNTINNILNVLL